MRTRNICFVALALFLGIASPTVVLAQTCNEYATKCITDDYYGGDCSSIGIWDALSKTCTLTGNLQGVAIQIASDGVTLDGGGYTMTGVSGDSSHPYGVYVDLRTGVTIKNLTVTAFQGGIELLRSFSNTLTNNTMTENTSVGIELFASDNNALLDNILNATGDGIIVNQSSGNTLRGNTATGNQWSGIILDTDSCNNTVRGNTAELNSYGISLSGSSNENTISGNTVAGNKYLGISLYWSSNSNVITNNVVRDNGLSVTNGSGIQLLEASSNKFFNNTISNNSRGIRLSYPSANPNYPGGGNQIYNNNFIGNTIQANCSGIHGIADLFNLDISKGGGNYWSDHTSPDNNHDGFVDSPYVFTEGRDNLPWTMQDGWVVPPDTTSPDITIVSPEPRGYLQTELLVVVFSVQDSSEVAGTPIATFDGAPVSTRDIIPLLTVLPGAHMFTVSATDTAGNPATKSVTFTVMATLDSLVATVNLFAGNGGITDGSVAKSLLRKLYEAQQALTRGNATTARNKLNDFVAHVNAQTEKHVTTNAAVLLIADAADVLSRL
jgi:parallel beta-helix repeat protein